MLTNQARVVAAALIACLCACSKRNDVTVVGGDSQQQSAGTGAGAVGEACSDDDECGAGLLCMFGLCREDCSDDTDCESDSLCLFRDDRGSCRLSEDTDGCGDGECDNAALACGLDGWCGIPCGSEASCDAPTQRCIGGVCVGRLDEAFDCGTDVVEGDLVCDGATLQSCNALGPGLVEVATCENEALCRESAQGSSAAGNGCASSACDANAFYCTDATLLHCDGNGVGPIDDGAECATAALCERSVNEGSDTCAEPECEQGETKCSGLSVELVTATCNAGRTGFEEEPCDAQCDPGGACIALDVDTTEVTQSQYDTWLASAPATAGQPTGCGSNDSFEPDATCLTGSICSGGDCDRHPQVCVDYCDAYAYCAAQGRRLCGRISGGMTPFDAYADPEESQWMNACSGGGQELTGYTPPLGDNPCNWRDIPTDVGQPTHPVGTRPQGTGASKCHPNVDGYTQYLDLVGNVAEWEDSCEKAIDAATASGDDHCRTRGGSFESEPADAACDVVPVAPLRRMDTSASVGFRCCGT